jgi:hypothetical protein
LIAELARLELRGAPAGVEVRVGNILLGKTDGSASFLFPTGVSDGDQALQLNLGAASRSLQQKFQAGQTVRLTWKDVAPVAPQSAELVENQDWERIHDSSDPSQLRAYLASHPNSSHAKEAASRLADLAWSAVDQANVEAVRKFVRENPESTHSNAEARRILDQFDAEQQKVAIERANTRQDQVKQDQLKQDQLKKDLAKQTQLDQERGRLEQSRKQVLNTLQQLDSSLQRKRPTEVKTIWPSASATFFESLKSGQVEMSLSVGEVQFPQGLDQAVALCDLVIRTKTRSAPPKHHKGTVTLRNTGGNWTIENARFN